jgi:hypothetical protein
MFTTAMTNFSNQNPPKPIPPSADTAETVERVVSRRQLIVERGDILVTRVSGGFSPTSRAVYQLRVNGTGPLPERFANFDRAIAAGNVLAVRAFVRLFYLENEQDPPYLIQDFRRNR